MDLIDLLVVEEIVRVNVVDILRVRGVVNVVVALPVMLFSTVRVVLGVAVRDALGVPGPLALNVEVDDLVPLTVAVAACRVKTMNAYTTKYTTLIHTPHYYIQLHTINTLH